MSIADRHVIIVGGGASGALLAISLLRLPAPPAITIVEQRPRLAKGFAYGEAAPFHLLNVRAANMSAYQDAPDHFLGWLDAKGDVPGLTGEGKFRFAPRRVYGEYLAEQLHALALRNHARLQHLHDEVVSIARRDVGLEVVLADGRRLAGDAVVLATGYALRRPSSLPRLLASWGEFSADSLRGIDRVLVIGTGHSAIDHVQLLLAAGYAGRITMMSRHGFLPAVHRPVEPLGIDRADVPFGARLSRVLRWFRARVAEHEQHGGDWRSVLDGMRPHAQAFWQSLPLDEQRRFIRHARAWYDVRRHRLAPSINDTLDRLKSDGRLEVIAGRILSVTDHASDAEVTYRRRGERIPQTLGVEAIIECVGFDLNPRTQGRRLMTDLLEQGLAQEGPHGFGLNVSSSSELIDTAGKAAPDLYAVGPLTRGQFWEAVGLPDVRQQCAAVAQTLAKAID